jgi:phage terminase large subunit-like protein
MLPTSRYDKKRADHAVNFISQLCHTKGEWEGKPFKLLPWQETIIRDVFGVIKPNGKRQFNHCFVEVCKKSGKSELAAAIALLLLCADGENSAEIYGVANDRSQAGIVFNVACRMVQMNPILSEYCKIVDHTKRIIFKPTNSFYAALSSSVATKFGLNTHGAIYL